MQSRLCFVVSCSVVWCVYDSDSVNNGYCVHDSPSIGGVMMLIVLVVLI